MGSAERRGRAGTVRWVARYRTPDGLQRSKSFKRKVDADGFLALIEADKLRGTYMDSQRSEILLHDWAESWLDAQNDLSASTRERYAGILRTYVIPSWGRRQLGSISHAEVQAWLAAIAEQRAAGTVRKVHRVLSTILAYAVSDGRLVRNVAEGVSLPRVPHREMRILSHRQVHDLAAVCDDHGLLVLFLAYTGARWAEMAGLRVRRIDFDRHRVLLAETCVRVSGRPV